MTADAATAPRQLNDAERAELIEKYLPLVGYITSEFIGRLPSHVSRDDLTSAGLMALFQASRGYDATTGVPFNRYANTRIRGAILDDLRGQDWASRGVRSRQRKLSRLEDQLTVELGRVPTPAELASSLGVSVRELAETRDEAQRAMVLSMQGFTADGASLDDHLPTHSPGPEAEFLHREQLGYLRSAIAVLPERLKFVVEGYFLRERPMAELAEELEVSESRISQMRAEALLLLREGMNTHLSPEMVRPVTGTSAAVKRKESYYAAVGTQSDFRNRLALSAFGTYTAPIGPHRLTSSTRRSARPPRWPGASSVSGYPRASSCSAARRNHEATERSSAAARARISFSRSSGKRTGTAVPNRAPVLRIGGPWGSWLAGSA